MSRKFHLYTRRQRNWHSETQRWRKLRCGLTSATIEIFSAAKTIILNTKFLILRHNSSFLMQNSSSLIQNSSFFAPFVCATTSPKVLHHHFKYKISRFWYKTPRFDTQSLVFNKKVIILLTVSDRWKHGDRPIDRPQILLRVTSFHNPCLINPASSGRHAGVFSQGPEVKPHTGEQVTDVRDCDLTDMQQSVRDATENHVVVGSDLVRTIATKILTYLKLSSKASISDTIIRTTSRSLARRSKCANRINRSTLNSRVDAPTPAQASAAEDTSSATYDTGSTARKSMKNQPCM